jgi:hypothetical protein
MLVSSRAELCSRFSADSYASHAVNPVSLPWTKQWPSRISQNAQCCHDPAGICRYNEAGFGTAPPANTNQEIS